MPLSLIFILILAVTVWNAACLRIALNRSTQDYLSDVTGQSSSDIRGALAERMTSLEIIADSIALMGERQSGGALAEYLDLQAQILKFDRLLLVDPQGEIISSGGQLPPQGAETDLPPDLSGLFQQAGVHYTGGENILYAVPVYQNGRAHQVLAGIRSKTTIQAMITAKSFHGRMLSCIVGATILIFSLFLLALFRFYSAHKKQLEQTAFTDPLTGGLNNAAFQRRYRSLAKQLIPGSRAIVYLNVSGFKLINEQFGTSAGNELLRHFYRVLERHMDRGQNEFAARGESDHFFLCLCVSDPQSIQLRLTAMLREIDNTRGPGMPDVPVVFCLGACLVDSPDQDITILQDHARMACQNCAPGQNQECAFYDNGLAARLRLEQELNSLFDGSIERRDFLVCLQPKISLKDNSLAGAEALVRWIHPQKGMIYPSDFIPLFEGNGKICRLDRYVFTEICAALARLKEEGRKMFPVSVNLSRRHFRDPDFLDDFARIAAQYGIPRGVIEFELTESIFFDNQQIEIVKASIRRMHDLGFLCSLDDFGSGFSSLGLLKEFDVDAIKLDRSFFLNMSSPKAREIIACLVELARRLQVNTVAEGIETLSQVEYLRRIRCDMVQGYVFSKPLTISEFEDRYLR